MPHGEDKRQRGTALTQRSHVDTHTHKHKHTYKHTYTHKHTHTHTHLSSREAYATLLQLQPDVSDLCLHRGDLSLHSQRTHLSFKCKPWGQLLVPTT
jgi:hypothetical protein